MEAIARKIDKDHRIGTGSGDLLDKITKCLAHRVAIEVPGTDHVKSSGLQRLCEETGVICRGWQASGFVIAVADYKPDPLLHRLRPKRAGWQQCD